MPSFKSQALLAATSQAEIIGTKVPYKIVVTITTRSKDVTKTFLFGRLGSSFNTRPKAIAPLIIPAIHKKNASEKINCRLWPNTMLIV